MVLKKVPSDADLEKIPGYTQGTRVNSSLRTVTLAQPICPMSKIEMERNDKGDWVPKKGPTDPNRQNCQLAGGAWWKDCMKKGHGEMKGVPEGYGPYFREVVWYVTEDDYDNDTGEMVGTKRFRRRMVMPNLKQVPIAMRINSGLGPRRAIERKGCIRLGAIGYQEVCQYRNCQNPVDPDCVSQLYGSYCCTQELALIAAEQQGIALIRPSAELQGKDEPKFARERQKQLREAVAFAKDAA